MRTTHDTHHGDAPNARPDQPMGHGGHSWLMMVCCIPMVLIAVALVATGTASAGVLVIAFMCTAMMFMMMRMMGNGSGHA
jgi:hypothetical protein